MPLVELEEGVHQLGLCLTFKPAYYERHYQAHRSRQLGGRDASRVCLLAALYTLILLASTIYRHTMLYAKRLRVGRGCIMALLQHVSHPVPRRRR